MFEGIGDCMKRAATIVAVLGISAWSLGQDASKPAQSRQTTPATGQPTPATGQAAAAPQGKRPPQAKTKEEYDAYNAAKALPDAPAREKAADDFAKKFPDRKLRRVLYKAAMNSYQKAEKAERWMEK